MFDWLSDPSVLMIIAGIAGLLAVNASGPLVRMVAAWIAAWVARQQQKPTPPTPTEDEQRREALDAAELAYRLADYFSDLDDAEGIKAATTCAQRAVLAPFIEASQR